MTDLATDPDQWPQGDERQLLAGFLDWYRSILIRKCEGIDDDTGRDANCQPSILTLMGLARHMADVERHWFRRWLEGADLPDLYFRDEEPDRDLEVRPGDSMVEALDALRVEIDHARSLVANADSFDMVSLGSSSRHPGWVPNLRWILIHLIEEYARHCGHADLLRERIDGSTGD